MRYISWVVALLEACDVTNNGSHLGFYQELKIRLKPREMVIFVLYMNYILATRFTLIVEKSWKNMYFHSKFAWQHATYDVISHSHSNWPSLNLSQNLRKGWTNSYWKRQVFMFYPLRKNSEKPYGGEGGGVASTPLLVRPRGLINKVSNDACQCQWNGHDAVISIGGIFFIHRTLCMLHDTRRKAEHSVSL